MSDAPLSRDANKNSSVPHIVIIGGGAGGLVLATKLAKKTYRDKLCAVTLVDESLTHIWKPLLHEVAAGSLNSYEDQLNYFAHAYKSHYVFQLGKLVGLNREQKIISLGAVNDSFGDTLVPAREISYDILVFALGSVGNDFGVPGVKDYCANLDSCKHAEHLHAKILGMLMAANSNGSDLHINIIGAGPTGVELASELYSTLPQFKQYGFGAGLCESTKITLVEAGPSLLPGQSEKMIAEATEAIKKMNVDLLLNSRVSEVTKDSIIIDGKGPIASTIAIWTTGVKAPNLLNKIDGLETNRGNQIVVNAHLQSTSDDSIYAIGDCAECMSNGKRLAPRAQVAQQQALYLTKSLIMRCQQKAPPAFIFNDKGTFVSLGDNNSVGTVLGTFFGAFNLNGFVAKMAYVMLYRKHQLELLGIYKTSILIIKDTLTRVLGPKVKLH